MTGSTIDGEDVVQDVLIKALTARPPDAGIDNPEGWLFRIAHNACVDFLRARARGDVVQLADMDVASGDPHPHVATASFRTFMELPVLQRCAVILKDVLGHSVEEVAGIADCSVPAAKSALQRGRVRLRELAAREDEAPRRPSISGHDRQRLQAYVALFHSGDFDSIRRMLADDVRLDLVNRLKLEGKHDISLYFTRYAEATHWLAAVGAVESRPAVLIFDARGPMLEPAHFVLIDWRDQQIVFIRDFHFAPYAMEALEWHQPG